MKNIKIFILILALFVSSQGLAKGPKDTPEMTKLKSDLIKLDKSIEVTHQKMREVKDVNFLPDLYFVLAELDVEKSRYLSTLIRLQNPDTQIKDIDFFEAKKAKKQAIETYQRFMETFPKNENVDRALFYMAHEYRELGSYEDMVKTYRKLTHDFPKSPFFAESQVILGDFFLEDQHDPKMALDAYNEVLSGAPTPFVPIARYKTGWCYINMDRFHDALLAFEGILTIDRKIDVDKLPDIYKKSDIKRDALIALVWPYSEEKTLDAFRADPLVYFENLAPTRPTFIKVLDKLAKRLLIKHKTDVVLPVYFRLIELSNDLERLMEYFDDIYPLIRESKKYWPIENLADPLTQTLIRARYAPDLSAKDKLKIEKNYEIYLRDYATRLHQRAKYSKQEKDYLISIHAYEDYMVLFPNTKFAPAILLDLGESYFLAHKYALSGLNYENLIRMQKAPSKSLYDSTIQTYAIVLKTPEKYSRLEVTQSREGFRDIGAKFLKAYPSDPASPMIRFNIARTYYDERDFNNAVKYFFAFINAHPNHKEATTAGNLILDSYNQREDYDGLIKAGKQLIANNRMTNAQFKADVTEVVKQAEYRKVQNVAGDPKNREYAQHLLDFASKYKGTSLGDSALYEAYSSLKAKKDPQMYGPGEELLNKHGDSKYAKEVVGSMGQMALNTADYRRAANYFEIFSKKYPKDPASFGLLKNAANMRELMGDTKEAADDFRGLGPGFNESIARQYALGQDWNELGRALLAHPVNNLRGHYWLGLALYRQNQFENAKPSLTEASRAKATEYEDKKMAAHALYLLATQALKDYQAIQLGGGGNEAALTKAKAARFQNLEAQFGRVIAFGNGRWTIAALYQLGRTSNDFANFIGNASMPAGLSAEQQTQYRQLIAQQSGTFKTKAKGYFEACIKNAEKFEVFSSFVGGCQSQGATEVDESQEEKISVKASDNYPTEATAIRKLLFDNPKDTNLLFKLSQSYVQAQDYSMARSIISRILEVKPKTPWAEAQLGVVFLFMGDTESAQQSFNTALSHLKNEPTALWGKAAMYRHYGFDQRFAATLAQARAAGRPAGILHPWMIGF